MKKSTRATKKPTTAKKSAEAAPAAPEAPAKRPPKKRRVGQGLKRLTEAQVRALLNAGWVAPEKRPVGRPKLDISDKQVEDLAAMFHTQREIAELLGCSVDTISDRFSDAYWKGRARVKSKVRKKQLDRATKGTGSDRMLIWLGVQELGQKHRHELSGDPDAPLVFEPIVPGSSVTPPGAEPEPK